MFAENLIHAYGRCVFLITGIMASGKSTVAQLLSEQFAKSVHVRGDIFRKMIVSGREEVLPEATEEALNQLRLRYRMTANTADAYFEAGFHVVVQDVIVGAMLGDFVAFVRSRPLYVVVLCPNAETVAKREAARGKTGYGAWTVAGLDRVLRTETPNIGLWLDSSQMTPQETVNEILRRAKAEAALTKS